jgi:NAD-dependent deacetylase
MPDSCRFSLSAYRNIVILTGAGVSAASGIPTFRGEGGLWNDPANADLSGKEALEQKPAAVWEFFRQRYLEVADALPNPAHFSLAQWENSLTEAQRFTLVTQNIDGLHLKAGSKNIIEYHGNLRQVKCTACSATPVTLHAGWPVQVMQCAACRHPMRPHVVLFGESVEARNAWQAKHALRDCDLFIAIGTSGMVAPASNFVRSADFAGARTILINATEPEHPNPYFKEVVIGKAEEILPDLVF